MQLIVLLGAELDIQMAFNRFEEYREGFGLKFLQELELVFEINESRIACAGSYHSFSRKSSSRV